MPPKQKTGFTGTAVQVKGEELRTINNTSFFDALKVFDPSFKTVDSRELFGSDLITSPRKSRYADKIASPTYRKTTCVPKPACRYLSSTALK